MSGAWFYPHVVRSLLQRGALTSDLRVLAVCGGAYDREVWLGAGFRDVTITGLEAPREGPAALAPCAFAREDAQHLSFADGSFDLAVVNFGLHHCRSPHRALLEMYRVARRGVLVLESRDNGWLRLGARLGLVWEYEVPTVVLAGLRGGGVDNTPVPNFIYHWTEREVYKCVQSYAPEARHRIQWLYGLELDDAALRLSSGRLKYWAVRVLQPGLALACRLAPRWGNRCAFYIEKPDFPRDLQAWLEWREGGPVMNAPWVRARFPEAGRQA